MRDMRSDEDGTEVVQKEPHQRLMVYRYVLIIASSVRRMNTQLWLNQEQNAHCADRRLQKNFFFLPRDRGVCEPGSTCGNACDICLDSEDW